MKFPSHIIKKIFLYNIHPISEIIKKIFEELIYTNFEKKDDEYFKNYLYYSLYNLNGYNKYGFNKQGYNLEGYDRYGLNVDGWTIDGYDKYGYDKHGWSYDGECKYCVRSREYCRCYYKF